MTLLSPEIESAATTAVTQDRPHLGRSVPELLENAILPVREDLAQVEERLRHALTSRIEGVPEMMAYLIQSGGKRIRPLVTCLMARALGYTGTDHVTVACVAELLHTATLYHDDVVDEARLRRGKPTANHVFGNKIIVLSGDLMLAQCFSLLMNGGYFSISRSLASTVQQMVEGEILELRYEGDVHTRVEDYLQMIDYKTASLFSWCAKASSILQEEGPEMREKISLFGHHIGMAFQLIDDLMDFFGTERVTGKDSFHDLKEGKITLPLLLALKHHPKLRTKLKAALSPNCTDKERNHTFSVLRHEASNASILLEHRAFVTYHLDAARQCLLALQCSPYRSSLGLLLDFLARREA